MTNEQLFRLTKMKPFMVMYQNRVVGNYEMYSHPVYATSEKAAISVMVGLLPVSSALIPVFAAAGTNTQYCIQQFAKTLKD